MPYCSQCRVTVPDITDPDHHVCVVNPDGSVTKTTARLAAEAWEKSEPERRKAAEKEAADRGAAPQRR